MQKLSIIGKKSYQQFRIKNNWCPRFRISLRICQSDLPIIFALATMDVFLACKPFAFCYRMSVQFHSKNSNQHSLFINWKLLVTRCIFFNSRNLIFLSHSATHSPRVVCVLLRNNVKFKQSKKSVIAKRKTKFLRSNAIFLEPSWRLTKMKTIAGRETT